MYHPEDPNKHPSIEILEQLYTPEEVSFIVQTVHSTPGTVQRRPSIPHLFEKRFEFLSTPRSSVDVGDLYLGTPNGTPMPKQTKKQKKKSKKSEIMWDVFSAFIHLFDWIKALPFMYCFNVVGFICNWKTTIEIVISDLDIYFVAIVFRSYNFLHVIR